MAKKKEDDTQQNGNGATAEENRQIAVSAQYIKDLSFENPQAPSGLFKERTEPKIDISVDVRAGKVGDDTYEVLLNLGATARDGEDPVFVVELTYGGVFQLRGIPENELESALLVYCPSLLFPFARRIVSDTTRDGGFPPLMLDPIDFGRLYASRKQQSAEAEKTEE